MSLDRAKLIDAARHAALNAYAPYSGVKIGAAAYANGRYYTGVNIDLACGLGFCAERSAASAMITDGEVRVRRIVCVDSDGSLMTPCGSCREFLFQLSPENARAEFLVGEDPPRTVPLSQFLPYPWQAGREQKDDR